MTRKSYERTPAIRERISVAMKMAWQRKRAAYPRRARTNIVVDAGDAKRLPRYAPTAAMALSVLLQGAKLLRWTFSPERGVWVPSLPKRAMAAAVEA